MAKQTAAKQEQQVTLHKIDIKEFKLKIRGTSPLIVHKFSEKARKMIEDKQQKKAKAAKEARDPKAEYLACFYMVKGKPETKGCVYGVPAAAFKQSAVAACSFIDGITKVTARGAFFVGEDAGGLIAIKSRSGPKMREDTISLSGIGHNLDLRYRPEFTDWAVEFPVRYNASVITPEQIINLFNNAGFSVGICEWRPQKNGQYGMFEVVPD